MTQLHDDARRGTTRLAQRCAFCGARLEVTVHEGPGQGEYACPECGKHYTVQGATGPHVKLLEGRTDGRSGPYSETLF